MGKSGIWVTPFCFGGNVFGWTADEPTSFKLLDTLVESGINFIDTADVYSTWVPGNKGGDSETIIGRWLSKSRKRGEVIIATKVGKPMGPGMSGLSKTYIKRAVEDSLKRLQTDYIDLYQSHEDDQNTPLLETMEAFTDLMKEGKVRTIGASNYGAQRFKEALQLSKDHGLAPYQTLQPEYNLYTREEFETDLRPVCIENNIGVINYYSLASGFLTGKYRSADDLSKSQRGGGIRKYLNERGFRILDALDKVSKEYNTSPSSVAIAWVIAQPAITAPIASATSVKQLHETIKALELNLGKDAIDLLTKASSYYRVGGENT